MKKILIIDDEEWLRELVQLALRQKGLEVIEARDGSEGIETARKELPDLILCDINMGKVNGYLTLSALRNEAPTAAIPFILMTGLADNTTMRHGMELGADDFLPKPFTTDALYAAVDARLKKSQTTRDQAERNLAHLRDHINLTMPQEIRAPLNDILSNAERLANPAALKPSEIAGMGRKIDETGQRLERLIENFLTYAQLELVAADPKNISALRVGQTLHPARLIEKQAVARAAGSGRSGDVLFELADIPVPLVEEYLGKIVDELTRNAFKFSKPGTLVQVTLAETPNSVTLSVSDQGCGFSPEQSARISSYMPFDRKMREEQGLGLGLTIAKRLVELHGGTMVITSEEEIGSVVSARFPKARAD